jgi:hypothetical protein
MPRMTNIAASLTEPLWTRARAMLARAVAAIGDASSIALLKALPRTLRRQIVAWLYPLECIVRRLLIAEAAELHRAECARAARGPRIERVPLRGMAMHWRPGSGTASLQARMAPAVAERCEPEGSRSRLDRSHPETWRASFSFALPRNPHLVPNARAPRILDPWRDYPPPLPPRTPRVLKPEDAPFRLARRFEALRRVLENPRPYAERLARVLVREARRVPRLVTRYVLSGPRTDAFDPHDSRLSLDALGAAYDAPEAFKDTS